jgi:hypothetical protein
MVIEVNDLQLTTRFEKEKEMMMMTDQHLPRNACNATSAC